MLCPLVAACLNRFIRPPSPVHVSCLFSPCGKKNPLGRRDPPSPLGWVPARVQGNSSTPGCPRRTSTSWKRGRWCCQQLDWGACLIGGQGRGGHLQGLALGGGAVVGKDSAGFKVGEQAVVGGAAGVGSRPIRSNFLLTHGVRRWSQALDPRPPSA